MKKILLTILSSGFLFVCASAFAADYSQTQNKVDDKMNSPKPAHSHTSGKENHTDKDKDTNKDKASKSSSDSHPEGPRDDAGGQHTSEGSTDNPAKSKEK